MRSAPLGPVFVAMFAIAGSAIAHDGTHNPAILDRMENMARMGDYMDMMVAMSDGQSPFNANTANAAITALEQGAGEIIPLFKPQERDPLDQASPEIWRQFPAFSDLATALDDVTKSFSGRIETLADLDTALAMIEPVCQTCHDRYMMPR